MNKLWGKYPFTTKYEMVGLDGPRRHIIVNADGDLLADFGGRTVWPESQDRDMALNEQSRKRAYAFCEWLNRKMNTPAEEVQGLPTGYICAKCLGEVKRNANGLFCVNCS